MKLLNLFRTSAVRLALRYALVYTALLGLALLALRWSTHLVNLPVEQALQEDLAGMQDAFQHGGIAGMIAASADRQREAGSSRCYLILSSTGEKLAGNMLAWPEDVSIDGRPHEVWFEDEFLPEGLFDDDAYLPVIAARFADGSRLLLIHIVKRVGELYEVAEYLTESLGATLLLALVIALHLSYSILNRMATIGRTAREIIAGDLSRRIELRGRNDEFDALAMNLNSMLDRIQQLVDGMREVTDNIAHDLRSPLTRLRNRLEVTLLENRSDKDYRQAMQQAIRDADALVKTFNAMLQISQADTGTVRAEMQRIDIAALLREAGELYAPSIEEAGLKLQIQASTEITVTGNKNLLAQAVGNLLDNAIKFTPAGGRITLKALRQSGAAEIHVADNGPGIDASQRQRVIQRHVRLHGARHIDGNGLGLNLVNAITRQHKATLILEDNRPGVLAIIRFPSP